MDNEPCFPLVPTNAGAAQSCSHAQHQHGMGKMRRCWMCSDLLPAQSTDVPKLVGNFPTFCSKSKVESVYSDIKTIVTFINNRKPGKTRCPVA